MSAAQIAMEAAPSSQRYAVWLGVGMLVGALSFGLGYGLALRGANDETPVTPAKAVATAEAVTNRSAASGPSNVLTPVPAATAEASNRLTWPLWEFRLQEPLPAREEPLTPVPWRLLGAAFFDGQWQAIVQRQGATQPEYYRQGDKLPGGYVIKEITQEDLTLRAGRREILLTYIGTR